jgi:hypothetical protein
MSYATLSGVRYKFEVKGEDFIFTNDHLSLTRICFKRVSFHQNSPPVWYLTNLEMERGLVPFCHLKSAYNFLVKAYSCHEHEIKPCFFDFDY